MAVALADTLRTARALEILTAVDAGAAAGKIDIYDGVRPAKGGTVTNLLGSITLADPSFTESNGVLTLAGTPLEDSSADADGTATWARITDSAGTFVMDMDVGTSGTAIILNSTTIKANGIIRINSGSITEGNN